MNLPRPSMRRLLVRGAFIVVLGVLLYAGLKQKSVPEIFHDEDKLYHLAGFAALLVCTRLSFPRGAWWWQASGALALGGAIELVQTLEPNRVGSVWDFLFDALGVALGFLLLRLPVLRRWRAS